MTTSSLNEEYVFEYFSQLNPIAFKIQAEINQTIENYEHLFSLMGTREQMTVINEAVIKPEIQMNYSRSKTGSEQMYPYRDIDASLLNYFIPKSELDRPFSYKTKSQQNLFYSFTPVSAVRLPVAKPKTHQMNKSTDSLTCVNFVNLNVKAAKKGRAPAAPVKMTTKPPPPPPPVKVNKVVADMQPAMQAAPAVAPVVVVKETPVAVTVAEVLKDIPKIPEDSNSNTSLLSPADDAEEQLKEVILSPVVATTEPSDNDDEHKSLLDTNGFDFLNNW